MAYFIHNKYDANSVSALAGIDQSANTVIDYYGEYETYKDLDVSAGFGKLYDSLSYITRDAVTYDTQANDDASLFNFGTSVVIKAILKGTGSGNVTVSIPQIDASKSVALLDGASVYLSALENTSLTVKASGAWSYQVIQFN